MKIDGKEPPGFEDMFKMLERVADSNGYSLETVLKRFGRSSSSEHAEEDCKESDRVEGDDEHDQLLLIEGGILQGHRRE